MKSYQLIIIAAIVVFGIFLVIFNRIDSKNIKHSFEPVNTTYRQKFSSFNFSIAPYQWDSNGTGKYFLPVYAIHVDNLDKDIFISYVSLSDTCWMGLPINNYLLPHDAVEYVYLKDRSYIQYYGPYKPKIKLYFKIGIIYTND